MHVEQLKLRTRCRRCLQVRSGIGRENAKIPEHLKQQRQKVKRSLLDYTLRARNFRVSRTSSGFANLFKTSEPTRALSLKIVEIYMKRACMVDEGDVPFCGITTKVAVRGLRIKWVPKQSFAKGVGGSAVVECVALIPLGIGGVNGVLETTVVQGDSTPSCTRGHNRFEAHEHDASVSRCFSSTSWDG